MTRIGGLLLATLSLGLNMPAAGQLPIVDEPGRSERTRADLEHLLETYEEVLASSAYSRSVKETVRADAARVRSRLERGDFRLGDRIVLYVEGEPDLPDTLAVQAGPVISLPLFGDISLAGALRSEVEERIRQALARFIRDPVVRAHGLMRVSIQGAVGQPGFYVVPADMLLSEALMVAGGPAPNAKVANVRIERGPEILVEGEELQRAMREGLSLDQLNLQAGDQIVMPAQGSGALRNIGLIAGIVSTLSILLFRAGR